MKNHSKSEFKNSEQKNIKKRKMNIQRWLREENGRREEDKIISEMNIEIWASKERTDRNENIIKVAKGRNKNAKRIKTKQLKSLRKNLL